MAGRTRKRKRRRWGRRLGFGVAAVVGLVLLCTLATVGSLRYVNPPVTAFMLQRMHEARSAGRGEFTLRQRWVPLTQLPAHVPMAVLASEDQRFFAHDGFDLSAIKHAVGEHLSGGRLRGASTLTQQVAKNLFLWEDPSLVRKAFEGYLTLSIEALWPKHRILEVYLNVAELGDGLFGVGAAATHYFGRDASRLEPSQAAALAAILPAPRKRDPRNPSPRTRRKTRWIMNQMKSGAAQRWDAWIKREATLAAR